MYPTQEVIRAEMAYRLERAHAAAAGEQVRRSRPSWVRRLFTRSARTPAPRVRPALP